MKNFKDKIGDRFNFVLLFVFKKDPINFNTDKSDLSRFKLKKIKLTISILNLQLFKKKKKIKSI